MLLGRIQSIRAKLLLLVAMASALTAVLVGGTLVVRNYFRLQESIVESLSTQVRVLEINSVAPLQFDDAKSAQETLESLRAAPEVVAARLYEQDRTVLASWQRNESAALPPMDISDQRWREYDNFIVLTEAVNDEQGHQGWLTVAYDGGWMYRRIWNNVAWSLMLGAAALALALLVAVRLQRAVSQPVAELAETAQRISNTADFSLRARKYTQDELGKFTDIFNQMLERIQRQASEIAQADVRFRQAVEAAPNGIVMTDEHGRIIMVNASTERLFGYERGELIGKDVEVLVPPRFADVHPKYRNAYHNKPESRPMGAGRDLFGLRKDGSEFPIEIGLTPIKTDEGLRVLSTIVDITERKRQESQLRESQDRLARAQAAGHVGTFDWDITTGTVYWSEELERLFGLEPGTFEGTFQAWASRVHPADYEQAVNAINRAVEQGEDLRTEFRIVLPDRTTRWIMATGEVIRDHTGKPQRLVGVNIDLTERKTAEETTALLAAIVKYSNDSIISKTLDGIIISFNPGAERMYGWKAHEVLGKHISMLFPPDHIDELPGIFERLRRGEAIESYETQRIRRDGSVFDVSITISPTFGSDGRLIGASSIARDISDRKRVEQERAALLEAERIARNEAERASQMKDEFVATLSHELRTPLTAILGWAQMLRRLPDAPQQFEQGLEIIERNARVQTRIIEDLLDISRIVSGKIRLDVQQVDLSQVIEGALATVRPAAEAKGIRLHTIIDPLVGPVRGDPNRLQQVVWNLLSNAIKFTDRGGRVQVALERINSHIELSVSDTGMGIEPAFLPFVFDRFRQADASTTRTHGGLGLGLAIVKQLVELHGGSVRAKSPGRGQGATFVVHLPLMIMHQPHEDDQRHHPRTPRAMDIDSEAASLDGVRVLVVDDEPDARELVTRLMRDRGAEVAMAASADDAMQQLVQFQPDVLVSDIGMPQHDGYDLIRRVRLLAPEQGGNVAAIALTAFARSEDRTRALMAGYHMHVAKPVEPSELIASVASLASRSRFKS